MWSESEASAERSIRISLISNYELDAQESMLRYPQMLERVLTARGHRVSIVQPPVVLGRLPLVGSGLQKWIGYIDKYLLAPLWLRRKLRGADMVHVCDHSNSMYLRCAGRRPSLLTCHDLIAIRSARGEYPGVQIGRTGRWQQRWITAGLARARFVICVSQNTAAELRALLPESQAEIRVIPHTLNRDFSPVEGEQIDRELVKVGLAAGTRYLLHVGGNSWYKNRLGAMRIFAELRKSPQFAELRLVLAGKPWAPETREFCKTAGLEDCTVEATGVSDAALKVLYGGAVALLFPSLEEGFGWPILEAQACGCPVITSNRAPMTEVAGNAAILIDPTDPQTAAEAILRRWSELPALREAGFRNLERFTEEKMAKAYVEAYEDVWTAHQAASKSS